MFSTRLEMNCARMGSSTIFLLCAATLARRQSEPKSEVGLLVLGEASELIEKQNRTIIGSWSNGIPNPKPVDGICRNLCEWCDNSRPP
mmetsp:Transcript_68798/g.132778  ORF Transcript_68798/g.132778 Transcript_68798/m.132778 type:complete len:88 (+) Transcript_68798:20-283(+)